MMLWYRSYSVARGSCDVLSQFEDMNLNLATERSLWCMYVWKEHVTIGIQTRVESLALSNRPKRTNCIRIAS